MAKKQYRLIEDGDEPIAYVMRMDRHGKLQAVPKAEADRADAAAAVIAQLQRELEAVIRENAVLRARFLPEKMTA